MISTTTNEFTVRDVHGPPPPKKRLINASDKVFLDVGGVKFTSAVSTLASSCTYFAALFSDNWSQNDDDTVEVREIFLDQDPQAFRTIQSYMRRGMIELESIIDKDVLLLADFLGVEQLLEAVKARAYRNLHPGQEGIFDIAEKEAAEKFDSEYGGIQKALHRGILLSSLRNNPVKKEYAIIEFADPQSAEVSITVPTNDEYSDVEDVHIIGALNWLHHYGFTKHEEQRNTERIRPERPGVHEHEEERKENKATTMTFSKNTPCFSESIVLLSQEDFESEQQNWRKEFVMHLTDNDDSKMFVLGKTSLDPEGDPKANPSALAFVEDNTLLEKHGYMDREIELEVLFRNWIEFGNFRIFLSYSDAPFKIYSRKNERLG